MNTTAQITSDIKTSLDKIKPELSEDKKSRMYKILNPDVDNYLILGVKTSNIEKVARAIQIKYNPSFTQAKEIFKSMAQLNVEEYKFVAFFFLNRYKNYFDESIPDFFRFEYFSYCHTWSACDSCCIRVLGTFLAKKENQQLAMKTIDSWSNADSLWIKRASIVILLKLVMVYRDFNESYVFKKIESMLKYSNENYIEKGIGWLLKTCSKYKPHVIKDYLTKNKDKLSRLILRYASEKLPKETRKSILQK
jgi:3-methyladenine DNA glycosylase AlkD